MITALSALNHIENGGAVLVTLPGSYVSSIFKLCPDGVEGGNTEIGVCRKTKGEAYQHFANMLDLGGDLVLI